jgi:uncharacterized repeat protein (TIGR03803 family)
MTKRNMPKWVSLIFLVLAVTAIASQAQTFTTLANFDGTNGSGPAASLVQGFDGGLYGTTATGGASGLYGGTVFRITPGGDLKTVYNFCTAAGCDVGENPAPGLILGRDGNFYGTTIYGGGTVFIVTPTGVATSLAGFGGDDITAFPWGLVQGTDGTLYGTTAFVGDYGAGSVYQIPSRFGETTLYSFCGNPDVCTNSANGADPWAGLVEAEGMLYGTTQASALDRPGTVFAISPEGALTTLHTFDWNDGGFPEAALVRGANGNLYGTTSGFGGGLNCGPIACGTVFEITPEGILSTLYNFCTLTNCTDGSNPTAALVQGTDGNIYGTTVVGGAYGYGTIFQIRLSRLYRVLHSFDSTDGAKPSGGLVQGTDGNFYGTTSAGGTAGDGTVFKLSMGLGPFVKTQITSGKVGAEVVVLGTNLTGATGVSFNGTTAAFTVVSSSEITTTVPAGATSGRIAVKTPDGVLSSNVPFRVTN